MTPELINNKLSQLKHQSDDKRSNILSLAKSLIEWMGLQYVENDKPRLLEFGTLKLKGVLVPAPVTGQEQLYRLTAENQNIRVRFAVMKKYDKKMVQYLVENNVGIASYQSIMSGVKFKEGQTPYVPQQPYVIHFICTGRYDKLWVVFNDTDQMRILVFQNRLSHTQFYKILPLWEKIGLRSKYEIADQIWKSLDVKEVNKEFYKHIKERFDTLVGFALSQHTGFEERKIKQFAVRLIGRYIFCWFLKEKGIIPEQLLGAETIEKYKNSFSTQYLTKLFFKTLNTEVGNPVRHEDVTEMDALYEKIPYLNGGLFDEYPEDKLFEKLDLNPWLIEFVQILERFDFTVDESSSRYQQVAIDPEMLGRIFENLLASQNPDTEKMANERKAFGAFYTPREIVEYMVNESLKAYLETRLLTAFPDDDAVVAEPQADYNVGMFKDAPAEEPRPPLYQSQKAETEQKRAKWQEKINKLFAPECVSNPFEKDDLPAVREALKSITVLDPACGSGAFPMGMMLRLMELRQIVGHGHRSSYDLKQEILSMNIFGIDIMPMAVDIARLRAWLSLVLEADYKPNDAKNNFGIAALPNLDFKFVCANTLIDAPEDALVSNVAAAQIKTFDELTQAYFVARDYKKKELKIQIESCINAIVAIHKKTAVSIEKELKRSTNGKQKAYTEKQKHYEAQQQQWESYKNLFTNEPVGFFSIKYFFPAVGEGFDVVIGNPPYGALSSDENKEYYKQKFISAQTISGLQKGSLDTFVLFIEQGFNIIKRKGNLVFIVPIAITSSDSMTGIHRILEKNCERIYISSYSVRPQPIFENAVVNTSILFLIRTNTPCKSVLSTKMYRKNKEINLRHLLSNLEFINVLPYKLNGRYPKISLQIEAEILRKLDKIKIPIGDIIKKEGAPIFYRTTGGRYFKVITPYTTGSTKETSIFFEDRIAKVIGAILSSNLYFWFYQIYSNNLDLKFYEIESFKVPIELITDEIIFKIENLYDKYLHDIEKNANVRKTEKYANIESFKEYKIGKSKALIDSIDDVIGILYGLTNEEIEFIKNYEISFRLSDEE